MSSTDAPTKTISDFEATLNKADTSVACFEQGRQDASSQMLRIFLRAYPTLIPALVLIVSVLVFGIIATARFHEPGTLSTS